MKWLNSVVDELLDRHPDGDVIISSGVSPSGKYHLGTLREILTAEALLREITHRGRSAKHIHVVDDFDVFRKVPTDVPPEYDQYLGKPLCDIPAPDGSGRTYADFFVADLESIGAKLGLKMEIVRASIKYCEGFFVPAIEKALASNEQIKNILVEVSGHKLDQNWSPVQVVEEGYLKTRPFKDINSDEKTLTYLDQNSQPKKANYQKGEVKLNWRIDWPARWWLLGVQAEPFGRDHATKGGSYDTGRVISEEIFGSQPPLPVPYHFVNRSGETKKMSKSAGNVVTAASLLEIMPPEIVWFFMLRFSPDKQLFFDEGTSLINLFDDFAALISETNKTDEQIQLLRLCLVGVNEPTVSGVPFSHLVSSFQASLRDAEKTLEVITRSEYKMTVQNEAATIRRELAFIEKWLDTFAPEEIKFSLLDTVNSSEFTKADIEWLRSLAEAIEAAPADADGNWFHLAIYGVKDQFNLDPKNMFSVLYKVLIGKTSGPRAGWFLSQLDKEWLVRRLRLEA